MSYNKETGMYEGYIYKIYNDINDKVYIGQTRTTIEERYKNHCTYARTKENKSVLYRAMNKHGIENFHICEIVKIQNCNIESLKLELNEVEKIYIKLYNSLVSENGYNIDKGGNTVQYCCKKIKQYSFDGTLCNIFDSITKAAECMECDANVIGNACHGKILSACGFIWRFYEDEFNKYRIEANNYKQNSGSFKSKMVNCYDINYNYVKTYNSITEAGESVGLKNAYHITNVCKGKRNFAGGFRWYYSNDPNQPDKTKIINLKLS